MDVGRLFDTHPAGRRAELVKKLDALTPDWKDPTIREDGTVFIFADMPLVSLARDVSPEPAIIAVIPPSAVPPQQRGVNSIFLARAPRLAKRLCGDIEALWGLVRELEKEALAGLPNCPCCGAEIAEEAVGPGEDPDDAPVFCPGPKEGPQACSFALAHALLTR